LIQFTCAGANGVIDLPNADGSPSGDDYLPTGNVGYEYTIDNFGMPGSLWTDALVTQDVTQTDPYANVGDGLYIRMFNATTIASADQHCDAPLSGAYIITIAQFQTVEVGNDWAAWQSFGGTAPEPPVATAATTNGTLTFFANWNASTDATGYYLDVATDASFTTYLTGFENLDVGNVLTYSVTAEAAIEHYYRLRAYNAYGTSSNSNVIVVSGSTFTS